MASLHLLRDIERVREIVAVLLKYRFDELLERIEAPATWLRRLAPPVKGPYTLWQRIRLAAEELGPTFIKGAQLLSTRPDVLPRELIEEFQRLRDNVTPLPFERLLPQLEHTLGVPLEQVFAEFNRTPVAAGSLGQIYRARLRAEGVEVAVKIQRPDLHDEVAADFEIMAWFAERMHQSFMRLRPFDLPTVVAQLRQALLDELDFTREARNAALFNELNRDPEHVFAPRVFGDYSGARVIVMEWIAGTPIGETALPPEEAHELATIGGRSFFAQIAVTGFFHGDPHPGNLLVTPDGRLCFIDWGLAGQLTRQMRYHLIDLFAACQEQDAEKVTQIAVQMGRGTHRIDRVRMEKQVVAALFKHQQTLSRMQELGHLIFDLIYIFGSNGINVARDYTLLARAVISIEQSARQIDPGFNLASVGKPYIQQLSWERWNPWKILRHSAAEIRERLGTVAELPNDLQRLLHRIEDGRLAVKLDHQHVDQLGNQIGHAFNRLSVAVIIAALIVGSSLVITTGVEPKLFGYPLLGVLGYLFSFGLGIYIVIGILRGR
ncbi:MAG: AarF/UbiB family protein [Verrucomicrobiota bacterium JB022]|nr:AarF/UbiB family protein [Verrucomicrobiota bacterium JB022]